MDLAASRRRGVIVAGMHRSGTSALTRVLGYCGLRLPRTLVPANDGNAAGHWESQHIYRFNDRLLARCGLDWISHRASAVDLACERDYPDLVHEGVRIIVEEFGASGDIVLKDPRICRLLPFWLDVFGELEIEPAVVLALRSPQQVALSLKRRNAILPSYGMRAWLRFTLEAERSSRHVSRLVIDFDELMQDWRAVADAIGQWTADPSWTIEQEHHVDAFLSADLRHFGQDDSRDDPTPPPVARAYRLLSQWQHRAEMPRDYEQLEAIRREFERMRPSRIRYGAVGWTAKWLLRQRERLSSQYRDAAGSPQGSAAPLPRSA